MMLNRVSQCISMLIREFSMASPRETRSMALESMYGPVETGMKDTLWTTRDMVKESTHG